MTTDFAAAVALTLAEGRALAEARMTDACRITRSGEGDPVFDEETGQYVDPEPISVYEGPCRIPRRDNQASSTSNAGEATWEVGEYPLALPIEGDGYVDGEHVTTGQTVTFLSSTSDSELVGNVYGITAVADQSQATARRFRMKRVTGLS